MVVVRIPESFGKENGEEGDAFGFALFEGVGEFFGEDEGAFLGEIFALSVEEKSLGLGASILGRSQLPDDARDGFGSGSMAARNKTPDGKETSTAAVWVGEGAESGVVELDDACLGGVGRGGVGRGEVGRWWACDRVWTTTDNKKGNGPVK